MTSLRAPRERRIWPRQAGWLVAARFELRLLLGRCVDILGKDYCVSSNTAAAMALKKAQNEELACMLVSFMPLAPFFLRILAAFGVLETTDFS